MKLEFWAKFIAFRKAMQKRFEDKEKDYGDSWEALPIDNLRRLLWKQCNTWLMVYNQRNPNLPEISIEAEAKELVDLANRALVVWMRIVERAESQ